MMQARSRLRKALIPATILSLIAAGYGAGYLAGLHDKGPDRRALVVDTGGNSSSYTWYDLNYPWDAIQLRRDEKRLKARGAKFRVARGVIETTTLTPEPDPGRVNSHR